MAPPQDNDQQQASPVQNAVQTIPPPSHEAMNPQGPPSKSEPEVQMRGGHEGEMCPGRFCFIIPCPIPCNFCIIPCC